MENISTICWSCKNACGNCSWSRDFKPVEGWTATKTFLVNENEDSYLVHKCPLYELDRKILTNKELSTMLGVGERQVYRLTSNKILSRLKEQGYNVVLTLNNEYILKGSNTAK